MSSTLTDLLRQAAGDEYPDLVTSVIPALLRGIGQTARALRRAHTVEQVGSANTFGDAQLNVDVLAEGFFRAEAAGCAAIVTASSEEDSVEKSCSSSSSGEKQQGERKEEVYTIAFDPLDGSSIIAPNWSVGSIVGVWAGRTALHQDPRTRQVAAVLGVYGPRTTAIVAVRTPGREDNRAVCLEVGIDDSSSSETVITRAFATGKDVKTRYFAPANLRAASEDPRYMGLVARYIRERYTLRYSGGLVPDVVHALVKAHGVYLSPVTGGSKAKLRRAYELLPVALVVECAGGEAVDPADGTRILDRPMADLNETSGLVCGNAAEVEIAKGFLLGEKKEGA
ncbi:sedoheptulose-1,7-bisphosphatase [Xylariaceae sp. FL0594]|nr:sedoheptulose-1,7-bisphosphatase [Xylariaceae sp. FL0594]